jgi:hypothetical protein
MLFDTFYCAGISGGFLARLREARCGEWELAVIDDVDALELVDADWVPFGREPDCYAPPPDRCDNLLRIRSALADFSYAAFAVAVGANGVTLTHWVVPLVWFQFDRRSCTACRIREEALSAPGAARE